MDINSIVIYGIASGIILIVFLLIEFLWKSIKEYEEKLNTVKKTEPIKKYIDTLYFFKKNNVDKSDVRDSEIKRILRDIENDYSISNIDEKLVKQAIFSRIVERNQVGMEKKEISHQVSVIDTLDDIDSMSGIEFEKFLFNLFKKRGYKVQLTPASGDYGVDLIISKNDRKIAIQAKRYAIHNKVNNKAVQEVFTGKQYYNCTEAMVITTSTFTEAAMKMASKVDVELLDRRKLQNLLQGKYEKLE